MTTEKLTNEEIKRRVVVWTDVYKTKISLDTWIKHRHGDAREQLLTLIDSQEQPKDEDVEHALEKLEFIPPEKNYYNFNSKDLETIRKALVHYGNMPKSI